MDNRNIKYDLQVLFSDDGNNIIYWNKILDNVNNSEDNSQFINYIKNLLINQPNNELTLDILDFIIHHGNIRIISLIAEKNIMVHFINLLKKEVNANINIQMKVIYLVQKWAFKFNKDINSVFPIFNDIYEHLIDNGIVFPPLDNHIETYDKFIKDYEVVKIDNKRKSENDLKKNLLSTYNNPFANNDDSESFLSDFSLLNKFEEKIPNPVIMDNNAHNPYDIFLNENNSNNKNINNTYESNKTKNQQLTKDYNNKNIENTIFKNNNNNNYNLKVENQKINNNINNNPFINYNKNKNNIINPYMSAIISKDKDNNYNDILGKGIPEPIIEKNKWCEKIKYYNNLIDKERGGICYNDNLRYGMQEFSEKIGMINLLISKYSIANDFNTRDMFIKVRNDMEMTLFRYNQLLSNKKVIPFYSAFDGNKQRYDENYYSENYYCQDNINEKINENNSNSENTFYIYGNKIKNTIVNFGCTIKEKTIDGYDYLRDKIKGNKDLYGYDYSKNNDCCYPSYSNYKVDHNINYNNIYNNNNNNGNNNDNNNDNNNENKNNNDNNNNEEKKQTFFDNVKEGFFNIGQSIKNLYKKDE